MATKKKAKTVSDVLVNVKVTPAEKKAIQAQAKRHTRGNVSAWLRAAALNHKPSKKLSATA